MTLPEPLTQALHGGRLLVLWGALPFPLVARPPAARLPALDRLPPAPELPPATQRDLPSLPPLPILSLDSGERLERAFAAAGVPLQIVRGRGDVPARGRHSLLKLAGDLGSRTSVVLSRAEVRDLRRDPDKRYLLDEARRTLQGGAVLLLGCDPADGDFGAWWAVLAPLFRDAAPFAIGDAAASWPEGVACLGPDLAAVAGALRAAQPPATDAGGWDIAAVRDLLQAAFTAEDLRRLFLYTSNEHLHPLLQAFSPNDGLAAMVDRTITFCQTRDLLPDLLREVEGANPRQYAHFAQRLQF